jgi:threonine/homoserine/homoserine lactone efflux protein
VAAALLTGFGLGFLVAAQVGPIWLLCARSSLRHGFAVGFAIGLGAAIVDLVYAALGVAGAASLLQLTGLRLAFGLLGAAVLLFLGARTLWAALRVRSGMETDSEVARPSAALRTSLVATASNPMTIASWAAIFAAASAARVAGSDLTAMALVGAVGIGSLTWFSILSGALSRVRNRAGERTLKAADAGAGAPGPPGARPRPLPRPRAWA